MLNIEQKLYQLIISRLNGAEISSPQYQDRAFELVRKGIGGFIIFGGEKDSLRNFINELQTTSEIPLFIASDIERGVGQQADGATTFPGQMAIAAATDRHNQESVNMLEDVVNAISDEALDIGINMPLIPVLDVNQNPDNPIICTRAFSDKAEVVSWFGNMYINALEKKGLISCAKHFPGHGDTAVDSHISLPVISKSFRELHDTDLLPFIEAVKADVSSIMVGHISVPAIDSLPASLSKKAVDILRADLGYKGLVLTDALNMHALNEFENVPSRCVNAGVDIILHPADAASAVEELKSALASGELKEEKVDAAAERILKYKSRIKNIPKPGVDYQKHAALSAEISDRAITLIKEKQDLLPIKDIQNASLIFTADMNKHDLSTLKNCMPNHADLKECNDFPFKETVIFGLFTSIAAWAGSSGIRDEEMRVMKGLIKKARHSIVVSFGSPYVLRHFKEADVLIAAYDTTQQAQRSVISCLKGERVFRGSLPVDLDLS